MYLLYTEPVYKYYVHTMRSHHSWMPRSGRNLHFAVSQKHQFTNLYYRRRIRHNCVCYTGKVLGNSAVYIHSHLPAVPTCTLQQLPACQ